MEELEQPDQIQDFEGDAAAKALLRIAQQRAVDEWQDRFRRARNRLSADLDVWAAVEVCRRELGPIWSPLRDDATGKWEVLDETLEEYRVRLNLLKNETSKMARNKRPLSKKSKTQELDAMVARIETNNAKLRIALLDVLWKFLAGKGSKQAGRLMKTHKPALGKDGTFSGEIETWGQMDRLIPFEIENSILRVRPRKGRWSGYNSSEKARYGYRREASHRRTVDKFLDEQAANAVGPCPSSDFEADRD